MRVYLPSLIVLGASLFALHTSALPPAAVGHHAPARAGFVRRSALAPSVPLERRPCRRRECLALEDDAPDGEGMGGKRCPLVLSSLIPPAEPSPGLIQARRQQASLMAYKVHVPLCYALCTLLL